MTRLAVLAALALALPAMAPAQTWTVYTEDTGALIHGSVSALQSTLAFVCNTPSARGVPMIETGDHHSRHSRPLGVFVSLSGGLIEPGEAALPGVTLTLDGTGYRLPPVAWDDFYGDWSVELSMSDPVFAALTVASDLVLDAGTGAAWRYPTDGLAAGLETALSTCRAGWAQAGYGAAVTSNAATQQASGVAPDMDAHIRRGCGAGYTLGERAIGRVDLDRDGLEDRILDWAGVTCAAQMARPFCGAANCTIDIFLTTRPGDPQMALGIGYEVTRAANGATGLRFGGTAGACARGECDRVFWWDGTQFRD
jgi:hypothetical protein